MRSPAARKECPSIDQINCTRKPQKAKKPKSPFINANADCPEVVRVNIGVDLSNRTGFPSENEDTAEEGSDTGIRRIDSRGPWSSDSGLCDVLRSFGKVPGGVHTARCFAIWIRADMISYAGRMCRAPGATHKCSRLWVVCINSMSS